MYIISHDRALTTYKRCKDKAFSWIDNKTPPNFTVFNTSACQIKIHVK